MLSDNPIFKSWYTDVMTIYRNESVTVGSIDKKSRILIEKNIPCRIYSSQKNAPKMGQNGAVLSGTDKVACDINVKIKKGDELLIVRGGMFGAENEPERYFAGASQPYYDPVGGVLSGLEHKETALLQDEFI